MGGDAILLHQVFFSLLISIHTTRVGGDIMVRLTLLNLKISIHTTRVGGDTGIRYYIRADKDFNPHHPCGW